MKVFALVMDVEKSFISSKTDKVDFVSSLKDMQKKIDSGVNAHFVLSEGLTFLEDDFKRFVGRNKNTTFIIYSEPEDHIWPPTAYLKETRNFVNEPVTAEELVGIISGKIITKVAKNGFYPGEVVLKKVK